jgi:hypothetical protein
MAGTILKLNGWLNWGTTPPALDAIGPGGKFLQDLIPDINTHGLKIT